MKRIFHAAATAAVLVIPFAAPAATVVREPVSSDAPAPPPPRDVPGVVLLGMATGGLLIVGIAARRRRPGRSVTS